MMEDSMTGQLREGGNGWEYQWQLGMRLCLEVMELGVGWGGRCCCGFEVERQ